MLSDATEIPQFYESLEAMFRSFEIRADLRAKLLLPFLSLKAKSLISRLNAEELEDYEGVRDFLLSEFKLTPREKRDLITRPSVPMKHLFFLLRGSEIICDIICVAGTVWTILSVYFLF